MSITLDVEKVERRRTELGLTKGELARRAGISAGRYTQILAEAKEGKTPFAPTLAEIAKVLELSAKELLLDNQEVA
jgi:transcriptional regulator with XRE-family HTH domain